MEPMVERDPKIEKLLHQLAATKSDPMLLVWAHVADAYEDGDCCKALRMLVAALSAQQHGRVARDSRKFDSCPFPAFQGAPIETANFLRIAWMAGYEAVDTQARCDQAERKIYEAYQSLGEIRSTFIESPDFMINSAFGRFATDICRLHGTILTNAVKQRIIDEEKESAKEREEGFFG